MFDFGKLKDFAPPLVALVQMGAEPVVRRALTIPTVILEPLCKKFHGNLAKAQEARDRLAVAAVDLIKAICGK